MSREYLNLADGQLAATSSTLLTTSHEGAVVQVTLFNTSSSQQTINLTVLRSGSTARQVVRAVLERYESLYVIGLPLSAADVLAGYSTTAEAVDYLVGASNGPFSIVMRDASGFPKSSAELEVTLPSDHTLSGGEVRIVGLLEEIRDALLSIA